MPAQTLWEGLEPGRHLLAVLLGTPRLLMILMIVPFMGGGVITGTLRFTVALSCYLVLHPTVLDGLPALNDGGASAIGLFAALVVKEIFLGLLMGLLVGVIFWAVQSAGYFMDFSRGSSNSEAGEILTGEQTTPTGAVLFQSLVYLFFAGGGFLGFLGMVYAGYLVWPVGDLLPAAALRDLWLPMFFAGQVQWLMADMILLSSPVVAACLLADISLGLISRSAPQLNVYVLAMPVKCAAVALLLFLYFGLLMSGSLKMFGDFTVNLRQLEHLLPLLP